MKKIFSIILIANLALACSSDADEPVQNPDPVPVEVADGTDIYDGSAPVVGNVVMTGSSITEFETFVSNIKSIESFVVSNNRIASQNIKVFSGFGEETVTQLGGFVYEGDKLMSFNILRNSGELLYDAQGRLESAIYYDSQSTSPYDHFFHFLYPSPGVVISEILSGPYGQSGTAVKGRLYTRFGAHGNPIAVGHDENNDNLPDVKSQLFFVNDNLVKITSFGNTEDNKFVTFEYSSAIDSINFLLRNSYGKLNYYLLHSQNMYDYATYHNSNIQHVMLSNNMPTPFAALEVELTADNFVKKIDYGLTGANQPRYIQEYFFE